MKLTSTPQTIMPNDLTRNTDPDRVLAREERLEPWACAYRHEHSEQTQQEPIMKDYYLL